MRRLVLAAAALVLAACTEPPTREIAAAEAQVKKALDAGAEEWVPERYHDATRALEQARQKVTQKDYKAAMSAASDAAEKARAAVNAVNAARELARSNVQLARAEAEAALDEIAEIKNAAVEAKIPEEAFAALDEQLGKAKAAVEAVKQKAAAGAVKDAQALAAQARDEAKALPARFRAARQAWDEAHPKKPARKTKKR